MTWFKVDDTFAQHPKVLGIPRRDRAAAVGLWTLAGTWCAQQLTDGHLAAHMVEEFASTSKYANLLVRAGLWDATDDGYVFHDWLKYNPSAEEVRAEQASKHEAKARAGRAGGLASGVARRKHERSTGEAEAKQTGSETKPRPVPTRPASKEAVDAPPAKPSRKKASTPLPDDFAVTAAMREWQRSKGIADRDADRQTERFKANALAKDHRYANWEQAWRNWIDQAVEWGHIQAKPQLSLVGDLPALSKGQIEDVLGPDTWQLPSPPPDIDPEADVAKFREWARKIGQEHHNDRVRAALDAMRGTA